MTFLSIPAFCPSPPLPKKPERSKLRGIRPVASETTDLLDEAEIQGVLTEGEIREVQLADLIVHGTRRADNTPVYLVAEICWTVDSDDVRRAANRASLLAKTGTLSLPVVVGERVEGRAAKLAQTLKVWQMTDADVVPPST